MDLTTKDQQESWHALEALLRVARPDTGQGRRAASFLLAWYNTEENGGWDPTDLWNVDAAIADDMLTVVRLIPDSRRYPGDLDSGTRSRPYGACGEVAGPRSPARRCTHETGNLLKRGAAGPRCAEWGLESRRTMVSSSPRRLRPILRPHVRVVEFFTANIRNSHTRKAYAKATGEFAAWCEARDFSICATYSWNTSPPTSRSCSAASPRPR